MTVTDLSGPVLAHLRRPRVDGSVRIAVVADPHVAPGCGTWKVTHRSVDRFERAVAEAHCADAAILAGDLTGDGRRESFETVEKVLAGLTLPWAAIPGNHDVPKHFDSHKGLPAERFADRYAPGLPFAMEVGPVTVLGVDTATARDGSLRHTWGGRVGAESLAWLREVLPSIGTPIVVLHHNVAALPENPGGKWSNFQLEDAADVRAALAANDAPLVVSAHQHVPAVVDHGTTREVFCPATCSFPQAMLSLEIDATGTTVRLVPLADPEEVREAYHHAATGKPLGVGILGMVERRLVHLPLVDETGTGCGGGDLNPR